MSAGVSVTIKYLGLHIVYVLNWNDHILLECKELNFSMLHIPGKIIPTAPC